MGGRGANSTGGNGGAPRGYRTVGKVRGIPVIKCSDPQGNILPRRANPHSQYFGMNKKGNIKQLRLYDKKGEVKKDIDWQHSFDGNRNGTVHSHKWENGERQKEHSPLTKSEIEKYRKAIEKATGRKDLIWKW